MRRSLPQAALLAALLAAPGCGGVWQQVSASPDEFERYRVAKSAPEVGERLQAASDYLKVYPQGNYADELRAWFAKMEPSYYARLKTRSSGLRAYLERLPDGPHANAAREKLAELEMVRGFALQHSRELTQEAQDLEAKLAGAERLRDALVAEYATWVRELAAIDTYDAPTSELHAEFIRHWRVDSPPAKCRGDACAKLVSLPYAIPAGGKLRARRAIFDVRLQLKRGRVQRAWITGPDLFDRLSEALSLSAVRPNDPLAHAEAIARAVQLTEQMLEHAFPMQQCSQVAVSPVVVNRQCQGRKVRVIAAVEPGEEDQIIFEPIWARLEPAPKPETVKPKAPTPRPKDAPPEFQP
ncbi:MAG: hypothetical protein H6718_36415 [Polyangiaceae bacterium]|nr:hypothetical protein [Myxococcales bacterium]MCB9590946.1 hypothetical protein [Polyangiaceae bacterium]MCB9605142.1 hypothetical protein [Polyangiaceae bacterium]